MQPIVGTRAPSRHIRLNRASNVRDLGGYPTRFGRPVRWHTLFRAGELVRIDDSDVATLQTLGLRVIYDLRTTTERMNRPARPLGPAVRRLERDYGHSQADLTSALLASKLTAEVMRERMLAMYRSLFHDQADAFRVLLRETARGELPLLFNCAGGKDRTGVFAALLLDLLGVSRDDIVSDYLLSNEYLDAGRKRFLGRIGPTDVDPHVWEPLLIVDSSYLAAMFASLAEKHGGTEDYAGWLGISDAEVAAIRENLLEPS